jgi:hypothetical protein
MNIILQHFDGELRELDKLSIANIKDYAKMIGADYKLIIGKPFRSHLVSPCQKVYVLNEEWNNYEQVLMLDIDMFVPKNMNDNVFNENGIGLYEETQIMLHKKIAKRYPENASSNFPYWGGAIYKLDKESRIQLSSGLGGNEDWMIPYNGHYSYGDEGIMHGLAVKTNFKPKYPYMERRWCQCSFLPNPEKAGFIHIRTKISPQGPKKEKIENYNQLVKQGII